MPRRPLLLALTAALLAAQQQSDIVITIKESAERRLAVPDFRGDAVSQPLMAAFNQTLWSDLDNSGAMALVAKTLYPMQVPQQVSEFRQPTPGTASGGGQWMQDWALPPTNATHMVGGYAAVQNGVLAVRGWMVDVRLPKSAAVLEKSYGESVNLDGARKAAHRFAADILEKFGVPSLVGTHIYYVHDSKPAPDRLTEIWMMDPDGANARRVSREPGSIVTQPAISPDGSKLAFVRVYRYPEFLVYGLDPPRPLLFRNPAKMGTAAAPSFTPNGQQLLVSQGTNFSSSQIFLMGTDGSNPRQITDTGNVFNTEPRVNPRNPSQIAFVSGRSEHGQIYLMNLDGTGVERLTNGIAEAANPSWSPDGNFLVYASTRKVGSAGWNIFLMDLSNRSVKALTHDEGRNEHPVWAPDGLHIVFDSSRSGSSQIWTMLANGTHLNRLTLQGVNSTPVWGR